MQGKAAEEDDRERYRDQSILREGQERLKRERRTTQKRVCVSETRKRYKIQQQKDEEEAEQEEEEE
jgi:hypothetical protein